MSESCAVKMRNVPNSKPVDGKVDQHKRDRTCLNRNQKEFLPCNAAHLCQPLDLLIIQRFSCVLRREREQKKISLALSNN